MGKQHSIPEKIAYLLTKGYTSKKVRSGRGSRTIVWNPDGKQVSSISKEWRAVRQNISSRNSRNRMLARLKAEGKSVVYPPKTEAQKADDAARSKKKWAVKSFNKHLAKITTLVDTKPKRQKFTWNGKQYTKKGLLKHINQLGVGGLEEVKAIWNQIGNVGIKKRTLSGPRHGTVLGEFESNKIKLNRAIEQAGLTKGRGFQMGHGASKYTFPELRDIPSNFALETTSEGATKQARATGRDLYEVDRRIKKGLGPHFSTTSRAELNYLISVLNAQGKMTPEIQDLVNYFKQLPSPRKYNPGDQFVVTRSGEEVMPTTDPETGKQKLVSKPGYARNLMTFLRGLPGPAKVAGLPAGILLAGMGMPGRDTWADTATNPYYYADVVTGVDSEKLIKGLQDRQMQRHGQSYGDYARGSRVGQATSGILDFLTNEENEYRQRLMRNVDRFL